MDWKHEYDRAVVEKAQLEERLVSALRLVAGLTVFSGDDEGRIDIPAQVMDAARGRRVDGSQNDDGSWTVIVHPADGDG